MYRISAPPLCKTSVPKFSSFNTILVTKREPTKVVAIECIEQAPTHMTKKPLYSTNLKPAHHLCSHSPINILLSYSFLNIGGLNPNLLVFSTKFKSFFPNKKVVFNNTQHYYNDRLELHIWLSPPDGRGNVYSRL